MKRRGENILNLLYLVHFFKKGRGIKTFGSPLILEEFGGERKMF